MATNLPEWLNAVKHSSTEDIIQTIAKKLGIDGDLVTLGNDRHAASWKAQPASIMQNPTLLKFLNQAIAAGGTERNQPYGQFDTNGQLESKTYSPNAFIDSVLQRDIADMQTKGGGDYSYQSSTGETVNVAKPQTTTAVGVNPGQGLDLTQLNGQQLFMKIYNGEIIPNKNNPAWSALYQNGTATPAQVEAYQKWSLYTQQNPNDEKVKAALQTATQASQTGNYNTATADGANSSTTGNTGTTDATANSGTSTTTTNQNSASNLTLAYSQIDKAVSDGLLTADQALMYKEIVKNWDPAQEINTANVLDQFKKLKTETIDPYFKSQTDFYINDLTKTLQEEQATRDIALETERANAGDAIRQAKEGQEKAGMTFSGKGIEALGNQSAYATPEQQAQAAQSGIPLQTPFGGTGYYEGTVNQSNRLMSSSSQQRYNETLRNLGKSAESTLGSLGTSGIIPGYSTSGGITGTLADEKSQKYASTFTDLMDQERQNAAYRQPITIQ